MSHQGYCWPSLGEPCGECHRCAGEDLRPEQCDGTEDCNAPWHVHGCLNDVGACTEPHEHVIAASDHYKRPTAESPPRQVNHKYLENRTKPF